MRATRDLRTNLSDTATWHDQVKLNQNNNPNNNVEERVMARPCEILFVDPSVSDIGTILKGLRLGVEARVLDPATPAARCQRRARHRSRRAGPSELRIGRLVSYDAGRRS
jgi:hypothetical protein